MNEGTILFLIGIILILILIIIFLVSTKKHNLKIIKTTNQEEFENFMKDHNFPEEMINEFKTSPTHFTSTKTVRKVKYVNGEKISDVTETTNHTTLPQTNCPNCGANIKTSDDTCHYCNTLLK